MDTSTWKPNAQRGAEIFLNGVSKSFRVQGPDFFGGEPLTVHARLAPDFFMGRDEVVLYLRLERDGDMSFYSWRAKPWREKDWEYRGLEDMAERAIGSMAHDGDEDFRELARFLCDELFKEEIYDLGYFDHFHNARSYIDDWLENDRMKDDQRRRSEH